MNLSEQQMEALMRKASREAARTAVEDLLQKLGVDTVDVRETQKDFAHLRTQRKASEQIGTWTRRALLLFVITSACTLLVTGIKGAFADLLK
ncbi:hypothetical protein [Microbulbifer discodermiae]|uniref:hypothetical protein n=1 Tax=Microbulbifer sp. 2201CG32-9 TaxID=3232309 RepID=UPI00345B972C